MSTWGKGGTQGEADKHSYSEKAVYSSVWGERRLYTAILKPGQSPSLKRYALHVRLRSLNRWELPAGDKDPAQAFSRFHWDTRVSGGARWNHSNQEPS